MNPAPNLILIGPMGAGKTSIGKRVAERLGWPFIDADQLLEARTGASVNLIFEMEGEPGFRRREQELLDELCRDQGQVIATGGGAVLDPLNRERLSASGFVVYLKVSVDRQLRRLGRDRSRPLLQAPDRRQRLARMAVERGPLYAEIADLVMDSEDLSAAQAARRLYGLLEQHWQQPGVDHAA